MLRIEDPERCQQQSELLRQAGKRIVLVPTMGSLHEGHLSLLRHGRTLGDVLVLSLFVNPTQFGPKEDFALYPRDVDGDLGKAAACGVDLAFVPTREAMYPDGAQTFVEVADLSQSLCGRFRPGHFRGVATVVTMLFQIVRPHVAVFGEKDYQQLVLIHRLVADLHMGIEIASVPTVREADGLALSSRNAFLQNDERQRALALFRALESARSAVEQGEQDGAALVQGARATLEPEVTSIDYVELVDPDTLEPIGHLGRGERAVLAIAAFVGKTRLIDSRTLTG